ncbi:bifunctional 4-hydroxy-3-methylbut-2-enyl diphosphate reductase/30S ribosomal protein S1 [Oscillospiraceae bacterium HV4-5-C5C]|nr:bifunctional 4-hydroxy-3-methylbut-2-enyl diphosphate reductase/30S ribosomal protein S1 [Oscillospiraceae bacterium HV4-5-C5C]
MTAEIEAWKYPRQVTVARHAGFCLGVDRAVKSAYNLAARTAARQPLYMLGELIHNHQVIDSLTRQGFVVAERPEDIPPAATVLIRAHGISPEVRQALLAKNCSLSDATCGYVTKIHHIVRKAWDGGRKVILTGNPSHPEIQGINGECAGTAIIFQTPDEAQAYEFADDSYILASQTTFSVKTFNEIRKVLQNKIALLQIFDTICDATETRQREVAELAADSEVILIIGSRTSSNTRKLFDASEVASGDRYQVETPGEVRQLLEQGKLAGKRVGVTAGASSPESIIREVIHIMSENEAVNKDLEQGDVSFSDFIDQIPQLHRGATVKGVIVRYDDDFVYVDVRDKSEGKIPRHEFENNPDFDLDKAIEDRTEIDVYVRSIRNTELGKEILLSKARVDFAKYKNEVETAFREKTPITVKVVNVVKDGVIATYGGIDIYIHRTQLELGTVQDLEPYRDQTFDILITQFDPEKRRLRVSGSRRALLNRDRKTKAEELWNNIAVGDIYDGVVRSLTDFGAFVDIGGVDGLVHISELSWNRIKHPSEVVKVGDVIQVYVKDFDPEKKRISLGYKRIEDDPYHNIEERFPQGSIVHGKVVRMFNFGAFVEIAPGVDALCHVSQISSHRLNRPEEVLKEGMEVDARVLDVNNENRRISISIKDVAPIDETVDGQALTSEKDSHQDSRGDDLPTSYQDKDQNTTIGTVVQSNEGTEAAADDSAATTEPETNEEA